MTSHRTNRIITDLFDESIPDVLLQVPAQA